MYAIHRQQLSSHYIPNFVTSTRFSRNNSNENIRMIIIKLITNTDHKAKDNDNEDCAGRFHYFFIYLNICFHVNLQGKPAGKRPLGRPRHRWENNIRIYLKEIGINMRI